MLHKAKFVICSEIHKKHTNSMWLQCRIFECQTLWYVKLPVGFKRLNYKNWVFYPPLHPWGKVVNTAYQPTSGLSDLPHPDFQQSFNSRSFRRLRLALNGWMTNVEWIRKDVEGISRGITEGTIPKFPWMIGEKIQSTGLPTHILTEKIVKHYIR